MPKKRLEVLKTYKLFIGGKFPRGESGRVLAARSADGKTVLGNYCHASRKDLREAIVSARKAQPGWAKATAYLRGQILYRAAELLQQRAGELEREIALAAGPRSQPAREVAAAIDRLVYYAGWTDKYQQLFGTVNPVATAHFNFTTPEPTGVVAVLCPDQPPLLALVSLLAPVILSGNTAVVLASPATPLVAITFSEILATSDLPGGVVNILTGPHAELAPHLASHMDLNAIVDAGDDAQTASVCRGGIATNLKRSTRRTLEPRDWFTKSAADPYWILDTVEFKTAWHPVGL
jgi:acyl-CoA reductase-like NAD-dependent aldehyde dehydrogenase